METPGDIRHLGQVVLAGLVVEQKRFSTVKPNLSFSPQPLSRPVKVFCTVRAVSPLSVTEPFSYLLVKAFPHDFTEALSAPFVSVTLTRGGPGAAVPRHTVSVLIGHGPLISNTYTPGCVNVTCRTRNGLATPFFAPITCVVRLVAPSPPSLIQPSVTAFCVALLLSLGVSVNVKSSPAAWSRPVRVLVPPSAVAPSSVVESGV